MPTTPESSLEASSSPPQLLSAAFLALRERSRALLRERSQQLVELEQRLERGVNALAAELERAQAASQPVANPALSPPTANRSGDLSRQRISELEEEVRSLQQLRHDSEQALSEAQGMLAEMDAECRELHHRLNDAGSSQAETRPVEPSEELAHLQRRLEMATQEIRELKHQNAELSSHPTHSSSANSSEIDSGLFDWESQKKRLLQQLESDDGGKHPEQAKTRVKIEEVIRKTERILAEKDRELSELRSRLANPPPANDADTVRRTAAVEGDEMVIAERARLLQLQEEWREKLKTSEVEISIERAKLARERLHLEERLRSFPFQADGSDPTAANPTGESKDAKGRSAPKGRWLTRLGLGDTQPS